MNWTMIGAMGELLGALAVVVSLIYLARQVKESAGAEQRTLGAAQRTQYFQLNTEIANFADGISHEDEWSDILFRGFVDRTSLSPKEIFRFNAGMLGLFRAWEARFEYAREGSVHDWGAEGHKAMMIDVLGYPGAQSYWKDRAGWFSKDFRVEVDGILESAEPTMLRSYGLEA